MKTDTQSDRRPVVVGLGEVLWDLLPGGKQLGGASANFAYHAQMLGAESWLVSRVGDDPLGREILARLQALSEDRIMGVETGGCPHTAIREDASINLEAVDRLLEQFPDADIVFIESGGDNLAATFSPELSDLTIYVIDVAAGEKIPRKGGPGITKSDLFVINKTDLAPYVGADLGVMRVDTLRMRGTKPFVMTNLKTRTGLSEVIAFIEARGMLGT